MLPLIGQETIRARVLGAVARGSLPSSILLHGPAGAGKERLALWIAQLKLCAARRADGPCETCQHCTLVSRGQHPDLHWYFPLPRPKDPDADDVAEDVADAVGERMAAKGAWEAPAPTDSLYVHTIKALVRRAAITPALAAVKVIVVADAHKLTPQEGEDAAANAFLKLLEEPLANTTIILTSSMPSALLPTIRSRVSSVRVPPLSDAAVRELESLGVTPRVPAGAKAAAALFDAARRDTATRYRTAFEVGSRGARGGFSDTLDALTALLRDHARDAASRGELGSAAGAARAIGLVEDSKRLTRQNVNPQLITATLLDALAPLLA